MFVSTTKVAISLRSFTTRRSGIPKMIRFVHKSHECSRRYQLISRLRRTYGIYAGTNQCRYSLQHRRLTPTISTVIWTNGLARWHSSTSSTESDAISKITKTDDSNHSDLVTMSIDHQGICTIVLNRPQKLNALNIPMFVQLQSILHTILKNQTSPQTSSNPIRVILVRGEGRAFCTGLDIPSIVQDMNYLQPKSIFETLLKRHPLPDYMVHSQHPPRSAVNETNIATTANPTTEGQNDSNHGNDEPIPDMKDVVQAIAMTTNLAQDIAYLWRQIHVPVIGCVHGMCYGGGLQMILGMDIRYVQTASTKLSIMESKWGLIPDMGASITLRELVAIDIAKELTFTGRVISGEEALKYGLVTKCVDDPIREGYNLAVSLVDKSPDVLRYSKQLYQHTYNTGRNEEECLQLENHYQNQLLCSYNQIVASLRTKFGWKFLPYWTK
jgi:enoyl-CoA hydratase/carnithine racemase